MDRILKGQNFQLYYFNASLPECKTEFLTAGKKKSKFNLISRDKTKDYLMDIKHMTNI